MPIPGRSPMPPPPSRIAFVILGAFFGFLGVHNFYIGRVKQGLTQLLITLLSLGIFSIVSSVWAIIDICTITQDAYGRYLT